MSVDSDRYPAEPNTWAIGFTIFAAVMMLTMGVFQLLQGIVAVADDSFYVRAPNYTFEIDTTGWGWIHIIIGLIVALVGLAVLVGSVWGRMLGIVVVMLSMISNFLFIPYYPLWSLLIIAVDVAVIWALAKPALAPHRDY
jgi:hypothetical protein